MSTRLIQSVIACVAVVMLTAQTGARQLGGSLLGGGEQVLPLVRPGTKFVAVAQGSEHSLGLKSDGTVMAWGWNDYGQCNVPVELSNVTAIAAGGYYNLVLKSNGKVVAWGAVGYPLPN